MHPEVRQALVLVFIGSFYFLNLYVNLISRKNRIHLENPSGKISLWYLFIFTDEIHKCCDRTVLFDVDFAKYTMKLWSVYPTILMSIVVLLNLSGV